MGCFQFWMNYHMAFAFALPLIYIIFIVAIIVKLRTFGPPQSGSHFVSQRKVHESKMF
jgi:hypothetical protein